jgi:hypothetical protein
MITAELMIGIMKGSHKLCFCYFFTLLAPERFFFSSCKQPDHGLWKADQTSQVHRMAQVGLPNPSVGLISPHSTYLEGYRYDHYCE